MSNAVPEEIAPEETGLAGVAEISQFFNVPRTTVSMWDARRETSGFPQPVERLSMGPVYDMKAVIAWHNQKYSSSDG